MDVRDGQGFSCRNTTISQLVEAESNRCHASPRTHLKAIHLSLSNSLPAFNLVMISLLMGGCGWLWIIVKCILFRTQMAMRMNQA